MTIPTISGEVSVSVDGSTINKLQNQVTAIAANQGVHGKAIQNGINKLQELIEKIQKNVVSAEVELKGALQNATLKVAETINNAINATTGINLDLVQNWEDLEDKVLNCANSVNVSQLASTSALIVVAMGWCTIEPGSREDVNV